MTERRVEGRIEGMPELWPPGVNRRTFLVSAGLAGICLTHSELSGAAEDGGGASQKTAAPVAARTRAKRYRFPTPGSDIPSGGAIIGIHAPMAQVLKVALDYRKYHTVLPRIEQSRVVGKTADATDVYMRAPILRGVAHIWLVGRFSKPLKWRGNGKKVLGRYVKGNLDGWHGAWKMYPCGPQRTVLRLELFIDVKIPVPSSLITPELEWAADKGVTAVRDIVECGESSVGSA
jgi:hypothetical protein